MAFEDFPSDQRFPDNPFLVPLPPAPERWLQTTLLIIGIAMFAVLMCFTWTRSKSRTPPVSEDTMYSARMDTYMVEYLLYQQVKGGAIATALGGKVQTQATSAGNTWRDISAAVARADAQARQQHQPLLYGNDYAAYTSVNAAALYGAAGNLPLASKTLDQAMQLNPTEATVYRQLSALYQPTATPIAFSPTTEQLLQRLSTGPLLRARNAQLTGKKTTELAALLPGERAGWRGIITTMIFVAFTGVVAVLFIILLIYLAVNWPTISPELQRAIRSTSDTPPWGIGAALIAVSAVFLSTSFMAALLAALFHVHKNYYQLLLPLYGAAEIISAVVVLGIFLVAHGKHPFAWSEFGWHAAGKQIGYGLATLFLVYPCVWFFILLSSHFIKHPPENPLITSLEQTTNPWIVLSLFAMAVVMAPLVEETLFRGILFRALGARMPFWGAALLGGFLFAVGHGELEVIVPFTLLGFAFAFLVRKTGNLWPSAVAHGVFNALAVKRKSTNYSPFAFLCFFALNAT